MTATFRRLACSCLFALSGVAALACGGAPGTDGSPVETTTMDAPASVERIDAQRLGALPAGQNLVVDMSQPDVAYDFDFSAAPIDFSRVTLRFAEGFEVAMDEWRARIAAESTDVVAEYPDHFVLRPTASAPSRVKKDKGLQGYLPPPCVRQTLCAYVCGSAQGPCTYTCVSTCN